MGIKVISLEMNLNDTPKIHHIEENVYVIGDMHGNALLLLSVLSKLGVIKVTDEQFNTLATILNTPVNEITKKQLSKFRKIISHLPTISEKQLILLGDTLSDRGMNDYFTLYIFNLLSDNGVDWTITLSNHDFELIHCYEQGILYQSPHIKITQTTSMTNMNTLIETKLIKRKEVDSLIKNAYLPHLKALHYRISKNNEIDLFTHALIDLRILRRITRRTKVAFDASSKEALAQTIDRINDVLLKALAENKMHTLFPTLQKGRLPNTKEADSLSRLIWNKEYDDLNFDIKDINFIINFIHGHDHDAVKANNIKSLDHKVGKALEYYQGIIEILVALHSDMNLIEESDNVKNNYQETSKEKKSNSFFAGFEPKNVNIRCQTPYLPTAELT
jgi:hypothetical protein